MRCDLGFLKGSIRVESTGNVQLSSCFRYLFWSGRYRACRFRVVTGLERLSGARRTVAFRWRTLVNEAT